MPAFTFEKISPPIGRSPAPVIAEKRRGVIDQILDRFVDTRVKHARCDETGVGARHETKLPE